MKVVHVTDASAAGILSAVSRLARAQVIDPRVESVTFAYTIRQGETPLQTDIQAMFGPDVDVVLITPELGKGKLVELTKYVSAALDDRDTVVHVHCSRSGFLGRLAAVARGGRDRIVYSPHGLAFSHGHGKYASLVYRALEQVAAVAGPRVVCVSRSEQRLVDRALRGVRSAVLLNTVDLDRLERFRTGAVAHLADRPVTIVQAARLARAKAPEVFCATADIVRARCAEQGLPEPLFRWIGSGDATLLTTSGIEVTGWLEGDALVQEMSRGDLLLFTSNGEGMPMTILDVQALDKPIVASKVVGVTEIIDDGRTGLLATTPAELADGVMRMITDDELRLRLVRRAREVVEQEYAWSDYADHAMRAYQEVGLEPALRARAPRPVLRAVS